jgi:hypothetical protein
MILFSLAGPTSQTSPLMVIWLRLLVKTISVKYVVIDRWSGQGRQCGGPWTAAHGMRLGSLATSCLWRAHGVGVLADVPSFVMPWQACVVVGGWRGRETERPWAGHRGQSD